MIEPVDEKPLGRRDDRRTERSRRGRREETRSLDAEDSKPRLEAAWTPEIHEFPDCESTMVARSGLGMSREVKGKCREGVNIFFISFRNICDGLQKDRRNLLIFLI